MNGKLAGRVAVVTGASKGIGAAIAASLAAEGAALVVNYSSDQKGAEKTVAQITAAGGRAIAVQANVADEDDVKRLIAETVHQFDRLDIVVNNAGVYDFLPLEEVTVEHFHRQFNINVLGLLLVSREAARRFGPTGGNIVNVSSVVATLAPPGGSVYSATKAAVVAITRSLAQELGSRKIRVNAVNPGLVETEGVQAAGMDEGEMRASIERRTPLGRVGAPRDIAPAVVFLVSDEASWITGETLYISGGFR